jgi:hypothetical protein
MDDNPTQAMTPAGWLEALAESEAQLAAGLIVPGEAVRQRVHDALVRLEARQAAAGYAMPGVTYDRESQRSGLFNKWRS